MVRVQPLRQMVVAMFDSETAGFTAPGVTAGLGSGLCAAATPAKREICSPRISRMLWIRPGRGTSWSSTGAAVNAILVKLPAAPEGLGVGKPPVLSGHLPEFAEIDRAVLTGECD
jgi:hypothetical protein